MYYGNSWKSAQTQNMPYFNILPFNIQWFFIWNFQNLEMLSTMKFFFLICDEDVF